MTMLPPETNKDAVEMPCASSRCDKKVFVPLYLFGPDGKTIRAEFRSRALPDDLWVTSSGSSCCSYQCFLVADR